MLPCVTTTEYVVLYRKLRIREVPTDDPCALSEKASEESTDHSSNFLPNRAKASIIVSTRPYALCAILSEPEIQ